MTTETTTDTRYLVTYILDGEHQTPGEDADCTFDSEAEAEAAIADLVESDPDTWADAEWEIVEVGGRSCYGVE